MGKPLPAFHGFIGQQQIVESAQRLVEGCLASNQPFPNTLLCGVSGSGKTHLAEAISRAFGTTVHYVLAGKEVTRLQICDTLVKAETADFLFIDEIHALRKEAQEILYPAIDKQITLKLDRTGRHPVLTDEWVKIAPVTVFCATDRPGELRQALRRRLPQTYALLNYDDRELREIVSVRASQLNVCLTPQATGELSRVCRGSPRGIRHLLMRLSLYFPTAGESTLGQREVRAFLQGEGIDELGLNPTDREYLKVLASRDNKPMSLNSIAMSIGHDTDYVEHEIEAYLVRIALVSVDRVGRSLTEKGLEFARRRCK